jgi:hypothetical protein
MSKFKRGEHVLWEGVDAAGGVYIYSGVVVGIDIGPVTGEIYYACFFPELKPSPSIVVIEEELASLNKVRD